jgi:hypothetical protein
VKPTQLFLPPVAICILMDLMGMLSFAFPALGEFADIAWAPISGFIFYKMFDARVGIIGGVLNFLEEVLPFTDIVPSFTIAWVIRYFSIKNKTVLKKDAASNWI